MLIVGLLLRFAVPRKGEDLTAVNLSIYNGAALVLFGLFHIMTHIDERYLRLAIISPTREFPLRCYRATH